MDYGEMIPIMIGVCCVLTVLCVIVVIVFLCKMHTYLTYVDCISQEIKDLEWSDDRIVSWLFDESTDVNNLLKRHHMKSSVQKREKKQENSLTKTQLALISKFQERLARKK